MNYTTVKEIAKKWGVSVRRVNKLCNSGRIVGAYKNGGLWFVPEDAKKPFDKRKSKNRLDIDLEVFSVEQTKHENSLDREYKKNNGIYYTPIDLIELMYDELDVDVDTLILDPCCGMGGFIASALKRGYINIYGADNDLATVDIAKKILNFDMIYHYDTINNPGSGTLENLGIKKPDLIIGNPPYSSHGSVFGNLFVGALIRSLDMVAEEGIISYIIPKNFLHVSTYEELRKRLLSKYSITSIIDIKSYFKKVRGEQVIISIKNHMPTENHKIVMKEFDNDKLVNEVSIRQNEFTNVIRLYKSIEDFNVYKNLSKSYNSLEDYCVGYIGRGRDKSIGAIAGKDIRKFGFKDNKLPKVGNKIFIQNIYSAESGIIASFAGNLKARETVTVLTDSDTKTCKYLLGILHSRLCNYYLYNYCFNASKLTMHTDRKYISQIPIVMEHGEKFNEFVEMVESIEESVYLSDEWHYNFEKMNKLVYEIYGIDSNEIEFIEKNVKKIQSTRWNKNESR